MQVARLRIPTILIILSSFFLVRLGNAQNIDVVTTNIDTICELERVNPFAVQQEYSDKIINVQEYVKSVTENGLINIGEKPGLLRLGLFSLNCAQLSINLLAKLRPNQKINVQGEYKSIESGRLHCIVNLNNCELTILDDVTDHSSLNNTGSTTATGLLAFKKKEEEQSPDEDIRAKARSLLVPLKKAPPTTPSPFTALDENAFLERTLRENSSSFPITSHGSTTDANPFLFIILVVLSLIAGYWNFYISKPLPLRPELIRNPITNSILAICSIATGIVVILIFIYGGFIMGLVAFAITAIIFWFMRRVLKGNN